MGCCVCRVAVWCASLTRGRVGLFTIYTHTRYSLYSTYTARLCFNIHNDGPAMRPKGTALDYVFVESHAIL